MSRRARMFLGLVLAATLALAVPRAASAEIAPPLIVPAYDSIGQTNATGTPACHPIAPYTHANGTNPWRNCLLPDRDAVVDWPNRLAPPPYVDPYFWPSPPPGAELRTNGFQTSRSFILSRPGLYAIWLGETRSEEGYPLIWYDVGSGLPVAPVSGPWQFHLAGKYEWECLVCSGIVRQKLQGTMYVIGPRAIMKAKLISADNSGPSITYGFDASGSFVTDYTPHTIVSYEFDFNNDGVFDQSSPEPTAQATMAPGPHIIALRVTDDTGRTGVWPLHLEIPYVRPGNPEPNPVADSGSSGDLRTGVRFSKTTVKVRAAKRIRRIVLSRRGLSIRVSGLTKGDRIRARLLKGKRSLVASGRGTSAGGTKTLRLRVGRKGKRTLSARPRPKRLVLDVAVEGTDGFQITKRVAVRVRS